MKTPTISALLAAFSAAVLFGGEFLVVEFLLELPLARAFEFSDNVQLGLDLILSAAALYIGFSIFRRVLRVERALEADNGQPAP